MSDDSALLVKVREALAKEESLSKILHHLHLRVIGGVVFLDGEAPSEGEGAAVEELIRKVEGVRWVQNRLQIKAPDTPEDREPHRHGR